MKDEYIEQIECNYTDVSHVAGLEVIAIEGEGLYAVDDSENIWQLAGEDYIAVKPKLAAKYPYDL
jgi:hypothetical protein